MVNFLRDLAWLRCIMFSIPRGLKTYKTYFNALIRLLAYRLTMEAGVSNGSENEACKYKRGAISGGSHF